MAENKAPAPSVNRPYDTAFKPEGEKLQVPERRAPKVEKAEAPRVSRHRMAGSTGGGEYVTEHHRGRKS